MQADGLQAEAVFARGDERQRDGCVAGPPVEVLRLQPSAQAAIADLRMALPEIGFEAKLNEQMVQVQLDDVGLSRKIAAHISRAHLDAGKLAAFAMRFDNHGVLPDNGERSFVGLSQV